MGHTAVVIEQVPSKNWWKINFYVDKPWVGSFYFNLLTRMGVLICLRNEKRSLLGSCD